MEGYLFAAATFNIILASLAGSLVSYRRRHFRRRLGYVVAALSVGLAVALLAIASSLPDGERKLGTLILLLLTVSGVIVGIASFVWRIQESDFGMPRRLNRPE